MMKGRDLMKLVSVPPYSVFSIIFQYNAARYDTYLMSDWTMVTQLKADSEVSLEFLELTVHEDVGKRANEETKLSRAQRGNVRL